MIKANSIYDNVFKYQTMVVIKVFLIGALAAMPLMGNAQKVWNFDNYTVQKISNPYCGEREADGLIAGGDRENSYIWRLAARGDEIYIATARNIASSLVNMYGTTITAGNMSMDTFWAMIDAVTNGDIVRNDVSEGANIISYNRRTGEFKVIWTGGPGEYQRMAVTFGEDVYFGSYSANPAVVQYILKLDSEGNFTKVFETTGTPSMRANCVYDSHLFFAGSDARTMVAEGDPEPLAKMAILRKSNDDDGQWDRVADYKDFGTIPYDPIMSSWAGAPIWELATHNGYIYATAPSMAGFVIYKGRPAQSEETANEYGWHWEEVAGPNNGINNPGLSDVPGGEPGTMRSLIGSVYEFNGELYAYNFDHAFGGEANAFVGMLQQLTGKGAKASEYLGYMYNSLHNPQKVWKLDDATGKFMECTGFTQLMEGTTNEYIWRMGEHNGQLYVSTMDAGIFYNYLTQLTNGNFLTMSAEEKASKVQYLANVIQLLAAATGNEKMDELRSKLEQIKDLLMRHVETNSVDEGTIQIIIDIDGLAQEINENITNWLASQNPMQLATLTNALKEALIASFNPETVWEMIKTLTAIGINGIMERLQQCLADFRESIDTEGIKMYLYINHAVMTNEWGFDLLRTSDGENYEVITRNGFDDKYNYGCPSFLSTEEGLYFGTCNPFYGGQLFLLSESADMMAPEEVVSGITIAQQPSIDTQLYNLNGQRVTRHYQGIYIKNGNKVVMK